MKPDLWSNRNLHPGPCYSKELKWQKHIRGMESKKNDSYASMQWCNMQINIISNNILAILIEHLLKSTFSLKLRCEMLFFQDQHNFQNKEGFISEVQKIPKNHATSRNNGQICPYQVQLTWCGQIPNTDTGKTSMCWGQADVTGMVRLKELQTNFPGSSAVATPLHLV